MNVTGRGWMVLSEGEKLAVLSFAVRENPKRWEK